MDPLSRGQLASSQETMEHARGFNLGFVVSFHHLCMMILRIDLVRSHDALFTWDEKFSRVRAAVRVDLTAAR